ncbi:Helix-turn-helix [Salinibacillus kushneri]|uniref:Helix-turn-helix n=1 Tax=Salinibacillus kushneri TaxID=237682 RepID=A0A1I0CB74_9BACI|nr:helix-turn-helix transcriptional regulator [Salinibacillus kushneri]SET16787.1 Helix-turn-helix [Salinibacillus kushneri]
MKNKTEEQSFIHDQKGRFIEGNELENFATKTLPERIKWIREELNKIYTDEFTVKKVASESNIISHQGLYNLENGETTRPRKTTVSQLAKYYSIPVEALYDINPLRFYLGKTYVEQQPYELLNAYYKLNVTMTLQNVEGKIIKENEVISNLDCLDIDYDELLEKNKLEVEWIEKRNINQNKRIKAITKLSNHGNEKH